MSYVCMPLL